MTEPKRALLFVPLMLAVQACGSLAADPAETSLAEAAGGSESITTAHFSRQTVPCADRAAMGPALLELTRRDLADDAQVRLLDHQVERIRLKDGQGQIAVIVYAVSPSDSNAVATTTEHFLISEDCRVLHWRSAVHSMSDDVTG